MADGDPRFWRDERPDYYAWVMISAGGTALNPFEAHVFTCLHDVHCFTENMELRAYAAAFFAHMWNPPTPLWLLEVGSGGFDEFMARLEDGRIDDRNSFLIPRAWMIQPIGIDLSAMDLPAPQAQESARGHPKKAASSYGPQPRKRWDRQMQMQPRRPAQN